jgi:hypothetical protein
MSKVYSKQSDEWGERSQGFQKANAVDEVEAERDCATPTRRRSRGWGREGWEGSGGRLAGAGQGGGVCAGQRSAEEVGGSVDKF